MVNCRILNAFDLQLNPFEKCIISSLQAVNARVCLNVRMCWANAQHSRLPADVDHTNLESKKMDFFQILTVKFTANILKLVIF